MPSNRQLYLFYSHHSMGRGSWQDKRHSQSGSWDYWPGSWSSARGRDTKPTSAFPHYDAYEAEEPGARTMKGRKGSGKEDPSDWGSNGSPGTSLVEEYQDYVNQARRAEHRVRQLTKARETKTAKWKMYREDIEQAFRREWQRYQQGMEKLDADLAKALQGQEDARAQLLAAHGARKTAMETSAPEEDDAWNALVGNVQRGEDLDGPNAILRRAMEAGRLHGPERLPQAPQGAMGHGATHDSRRMAEQFAQMAAMFAGPSGAPPGLGPGAAGPGMSWGFGPSMPGPAYFAHPGQPTAAPPSDVFGPGGVPYAGAPPPVATSISPAPSPDARTRGLEQSKSKQRAAPYSPPAGKQSLEELLSVKRAEAAALEAQAAAARAGPEPPTTGPEEPATGALPARARPVEAHLLADDDDEDLLEVDGSESPHG